MFYISARKMATYFKKKSHWVVGLILGLVLPAFLLPFNHFHSEYSHPHPNQVAAYEHPAHFHSEVLEAYAHFLMHIPLTLSRIKNIIKPILLRITRRMMSLFSNCTVVTSLPSKKLIL